jgi:CDP-glucose 4,6-dehydratase
LSLNIPTSPSLFTSSGVDKFVEDYRLDIRDQDSVRKIFHKVRPDFVFHMAAQALVRSSYLNPVDTFSANALGTVNVLDAIRTIDKKIVAVIITSDKVYDNVEWVWGYRENDKIGGKDPYSASKGMAEIAINSYIESYFNSPDSNVLIGIARAGNVIGGGDWAADRIVPDCVKSWSKEETVKIRNPKSTRPWQHVLEPLSGYLTLALNLDKNAKYSGEAYNFGPHADQNFPVEELINEISNHWGNIKWKDTSVNSGEVHEAGLLKLNCDKALVDLNWSPNLSFEETVKMTVEWYKEFYSNENTNMHSYTISQIDQYQLVAKKRRKSWI